MENKELQMPWLRVIVKLEGVDFGLEDLVTISLASDFGAQGFYIRIADSPVLSYFHIT
jgi:hypothetical protein